MDFYIQHFSFHETNYQKSHIFQGFKVTLKVTIRIVFCLICQYIFINPEETLHLVHMFYFETNS